MSTPSDHSPLAVPMELDSTEKQLIFLAEECRQALLDGDPKTAEKFWNLLHPHLQEAFRALVKKFTLNSSDKGDLHSVAATAVWRKIKFFDLPKAQNRKRPFTGWALDQGRYAIIEHFQKMGLSKVMAHHKKAIIEKLIELKRFPNGPEEGETWLDLAREHAQELASPPDLTETMIRNVLAAWSLQNAENFDQITFGGHEAEPSETEDAPEWNQDSELQKAMWASYGANDDARSWIDDRLQRALAKLDPRSRRFLLQKHVSGLSYAEIVEKYNLEKPAQKETTENARKIVSNAIKCLRDDLGGLE